MNQSATMFILFFFLNTAFLCAMDTNPDDNGAVAHLSKRLGSLNIVSPESRQTRYGQVKSCEELSKKIDALIKENCVLSSVKGMAEKRLFISEKKAIDALKYIYSTIPTTIDGLSQEDIFNTLYQKNRFFRSLVDQLVCQKSMQLEAVVGSTIDTVLSQEDSFPLLPLAMKKYLLAQAEEYFHKGNLAPSIHIFEGHTDRILSIDYHEKRQQLASASADKTVRFWNPKTGECEYVYECSAPVTSLDYSGNGSVIALANNTHYVALLDSCTYATTHTLFYPEPIAGVSWSETSDLVHLLAASNSTKSLYLRDMVASPPHIISVFQLNIGSGLYGGFDCIGENRTFKASGNNIYWMKEGKPLSLCRKALTNSRDDKKELEKLHASRSIENLCEIDKKLFKAEITARIKECNGTD